MYDVLSFPMMFQSLFDKNITAYEHITSITNDTNYDIAVGHLLNLVRVDRRNRGG